VRKKLDAREKKAGEKKILRARKNCVRKNCSEVPADA
jgi:hypothetical protein